ncbi:NAD-dependent deacetylase [Tsukamurella pulmonis]|uniref:NAD-dependent protein deacetylase n=1 Tax=Tsukamurella pulmonis TaxID=47312 RepID=A0A1H1DMH4_9ACTN|nr:Sir2 family NAD-dependent protein deacetylase [Tsukamurella pulmonis]KXO92283.1 NAD-dependent deacetylase [Tsukamurella pulmonis]KXP09926.1 NAD-dependent deacetylase [Tsukamurella pulmonis]RDH11505.1 NAD-dependent deacetylase [Tsukamurella pulmonis]SDQ77459.1 NAD-dependent protein deacetylase, SIR2 family [Tsukamurella pulmonis]SUP21919.1 NAD-dependent deacetylase [Tsukamurella pulmonis]
MRTATPAWEPAEATTPDPDFVDRLDRARALLHGRRIVALTGAGVSTASGIPDYRSPGAPRRTPMTLQQFLGSAEFRRRYWARNHLGWRHMDSALPNAAHRGLAALPGVSAVITQNVDLLHLKAGSRGVIDLHGNYAQVRCLSCEYRISRHALHARLAPLNADFTARIAGRGALEVAPDADVVVEDTTDFTMVDCPECQGILKPDIVYFGESVPKPRVARAFAAVDGADALLVLGTSLTVMSGLRFVRHAHRRGTPVVIVNRGRTRGDGLADVTVDVDVATALRHLADDRPSSTDREETP